MQIRRALSRLLTLLCAALLLLGACQAGQFNAPPSTPRPGFQKGMNYTAWAKGQFSRPESDRSLINLAHTGADWVAIVFFGYQRTYTSTVVTRDVSRTPTDAEIAHAIAAAHDLGLQVMLKPQVDLRHDVDHWRGDIGQGFTDEAQWQAWFASYEAFINHYARLAQENGVQQFCVGTELVSTSHREADWRRVVAGVRRRFAGDLTYAGNHGTEDVGIAWWDALDFIGIDAYYVLSDSTDPTVAQLKAAWVEQGYVETMASLAERFGRPVLITEIGYRSADGTVKTPWDWSDLPLDLQEQADAYQAALDVLWDQPWLAGIYWWNWDVNPQTGGPQDKDYTPYGKPAEQVLRAYYGGAPKAAPLPTTTPHDAGDLASARLPAPDPAFAAYPGWTAYTDVAHVNDLAFDGDGDLWIATPGGAIEWNRSRDTYTHYTTMHGLVDNWVEAIALAPDGDLWLATGGGISRFNNQVWITYTKDNGLPSNGVTDIAFAPNGDVWVGTFGSGASRFDGHTWTTYTEAQGLLEDHVLCVTAASDGSLLFGTWRGVSRLAGGEWVSYTVAQGLTHHGVETIAQDHTGALWFGTWDGVSRLSGTIWTAYGTEQGMEGWIESIAVAPDGTAWAATRRGVARFDQAVWTWVPQLSVPPQPRERGLSLAFAPDGTVWAGAYNGGLYHFDGARWTHLTFGDSPAGNQVRALAAAPDGGLWIGVQPDRYGMGGVSHFDGAVWTTYSITDSLESTTVTAMAAAPDGAALPGVWVAAGENDLYHFDGVTWAPQSLPERWIGERVTALAIGPQDRLWVGFRHALLRFDGRAWTRCALPEGLSGVRALAAGAEGGLWVGGDAGLHRFDGRSWQHVEQEPIWGLAAAPGGGLWASVEGGLARFDGRAWQPCSIEAGPVAGTVHALAVGADGAVWIGTSDGLFYSSDRLNCILSH